MRLMRTTLLLILLVQALPALAQNAGSTAFCLFPVPADGGVQMPVILDALQAEIDRVREDEDFMALLHTLVERDKEILDRLAE